MHARDRVEEALRQNTLYVKFLGFSRKNATHPLEKWKRNIVSKKADYTYERIPSGKL